MRSQRMIVRWFVALGVMSACVAQGTVAQTQGPGPARPGQVSSDARVMRAGLGLGAGSLQSEEMGISAHAALSVSTRRDRVWTVRAMLLEEWTLFTSPAESVWDVGALYGVQRKTRLGYASASAGISLVGGMRRGARLPPSVTCATWDFFCALAAGLLGTSYEEVPFHTVGIPLHLEAGWTPLDHLGLSVSGFGNVNPERSALGVSLGVVLGRVR